MPEVLIFQPLKLHNLYLYVFNYLLKLILKKTLLLLRLCIHLGVMCLSGHIFWFFFHRNKKIILLDLGRYKKAYKLDKNDLLSYVYLFIKVKQFRNLFYYRLESQGIFICKFLYPSDNSLTLSCDKIMDGLVFFHAYATILNAKYIGQNCTIRHLTTLGNKNNDNNLRPTILDNVDIGANVSIIGDVTIGNNSVIGVGSVVVKDVPDNCVVVGNPAYIIYKDSVRVNVKL